MKNFVQLIICLACLFGVSAGSEARGQNVGRIIGQPWNARLTDSGDIRLEIGVFPFPLGIIWRCRRISTISSQT
jgi:hypothetical protein